ncbi:hypothetical protein [Sulfurimonas sp.]
MKKLNLVALILGAALFLGFGATTASAQGMKCGAGKCGKAMEKPLKAGKCTNKDCECGDNCQCGANCKCGKNGNSKKAAKASMKCGAGKCGTK